MEPKIVWLAVFVALYWAFCLFWGIRGAITLRTAGDYFLAGRRLGPWLFVLAATAISFSGWAFPGLSKPAHAGGFPHAYAALAAIAIPFTGLLFLKRQWILGRRFGFVTPGEMLSYYFRSDAIRLLVLLVALVFSVPYLGIQLRAAGLLLHGLTDGVLNTDAGMWALGAVLFVYVAAGGLRTVAQVAVLQCILLVAGMVIVGALALDEVGWTALGQHLGLLAGTDTLAPDGSSHAVRLVADGGSAEGGVMILTAMLALMGIQAAPAFSMWAFASRDPAPFAPQQVWASSLVMGLILLLFAAVQSAGGQPVEPIADAAPWLVGLVAVCALAALQAASASYISTAGAMLTRDLVRHFFMPNVGHGLQKLLGRIGVGVIVLLALLVGTGPGDALVLVGSLALACGLQLWPALIAVCYWPFLTRAGVVLGLIAGLVAVTLTEALAQSWLGITAWDRWPLTIHSAGWGIVCNLVVTLAVSAVTEDDMDRKMEFHNFLAQHAMLPTERRRLIPVAWVLALAWFLFAIGPGMVIGEWVFGSPSDPTGWRFGVAPIWAWQVLWWALGVVLMGFLAYVMQMATVPQTDVESLAEDVAEIEQARI